MVLYIEDLYSKKKEIINKAIEEVNKYLDNKDYLNNKDLNLAVSSDENISYSGEEYMYLSFTIWKEIYKNIPEFLLFTEGNIFTEICYAYKLFSGANDRELLQFSYEKALERGILKEDIEDRFNLYYNDYSNGLTLNKGLMIS